MWEEDYAFIVLSNNFLSLIWKLTINIYFFEKHNQYLFNMFNFKREVFCYFNVCIFHTIKNCKIIERPWAHSLCTLVYEMHALEDNTGDSTVPKIFRNLLGSLIPWRLTWKKKLYICTWKYGGSNVYIYIYIYIYFDP